MIKIGSKGDRNVVILGDVTLDDVILARSAQKLLTQLPAAGNSYLLLSAAMLRVYISKNNSCGLSWLCLRPVFCKFELFMIYCSCSFIVEVSLL